MLQTGRAEKVDEKWGHLRSFYVLFLSYNLQIVEKKALFLQLCADLSKKSKNTKAIYIYASERSGYALSENGIVYYAMT